MPRYIAWTDLSNRHLRTTRRRLYSISSRFKTAEKLGLEGETHPLTMCWSNTTGHFDPTSRRVNVLIKCLYEDEVFTLNNGRTQSLLDFPRQTVDTVKLQRRWSLLSSIEQPLPSRLRRNQHFDWPRQL